MPDPARVEDHQRAARRRHLHPRAAAAATGPFPAAAASAASSASGTATSSASSAASASSACSAASAAARRCGEGIYPLSYPLSCGELGAQRTWLGLG